MKTQLGIAISAITALFQATNSAYAQAPSSISGSTFLVEVADGSAPFGDYGYYMFLPANSGSSYQVINIYDILNSSGTYVYNVNSPATATINLNDSEVGSGIARASFEDDVFGTFLVTSTLAPGAFQRSYFDFTSMSAPSSVAGKTLLCTVYDGLSPFADNGSFTLRVAASGKSYEIIGDGMSTENGLGTYTYSLVNRSCGKMEASDSDLGQVSGYLAFYDAGEGFYAMTDPFGGFQVGYFEVVDTITPTLTITTPTSGQRVLTSSGQWLVKGTASDNVGVAEVRLKLNNAGWQTASGTTAWQSLMTLLPGSNTVSAYALDGAGNQSLTSTISFTHVVTSALTVQTVGAGTLSPNYAGQALEIGKSYTLSAKAAKGFTFRGWTGGVISPLAKLSFVMQPGLTLTANFADTTKPTLKVLSPKKKAKLTAAPLSVTGTAADNGTLVAVKCQLNGGAWTTANGTTSWQTGLHLVSGANTIKVYAVDAAGNLSTTNTLIVTYTATGARAASEWAAAVAPVLSIRREGDEILVSWPADAAGYSVESADTLDESAIWTPITHPTDVVDGQNTLTDKLGDQPKFYRLRK